MKSSVAIAMIVCGTILLAVPYLHNAMVIEQITDAMVALDQSVDLKAPMFRHAAILCMLGGGLMVLVGAIAGLRTGRSS